MPAVRTPGSPEWYRHLEGMIREERETPKRWFYLSFADECRGFLGAAIVEAHGPATALMRVHELGISPGGEVLTVEIPRQDGFPLSITDRLLTRRELEEMDKTA